MVTNNSNNPSDCQYLGNSSQLPINLATPMFHYSSNSSWLPINPAIPLIANNLLTWLSINPVISLIVNNSVIPHGYP